MNDLLSELSKNETWELTPDCGVSGVVNIPLVSEPHASQKHPEKEKGKETKESRRRRRVRHNSPQDPSGNAKPSQRLPSTRRSSRHSSRAEESRKMPSATSALVLVDAFAPITPPAAFAKPVVAPIISNVTEPVITPHSHAVSHVDRPSLPTRRGSSARVPVRREGANDTGSYLYSRIDERPRSPQRYPSSSSPFHGGVRAYSPPLGRRSGLVASHLPASAAPFRRVPMEFLLGTRRRPQDPPSYNECLQKQTLSRCSYQRYEGRRDTRELPPPPPPPLHHGPFSILSREDARRMDVRDIFPSRGHRESREESHYYRDRDAYPRLRRD